MLFEFATLLLIGVGAGLLAGIFGVGGGALIVPALIFTLKYFNSVSGEWLTHIAIACSLATIIGTSIVSTWSHHNNHNVNWAMLQKMLIGSIIGTIIGSNIAAYIPGLWLRWIFIIFLIYTSFKFIFRTTKTNQTPDQVLQPSNAAFIAVGTGIGIFAALVGVGGGVMVVPFLKKCGLHIRQAIGTSAAFTLPIALSGTIGYSISGWTVPDLPPYSTGFVYWPAAIAIMLTSMPMAKVGANLVQKISVNKLTQLFGLFLFLVAVKLMLS